MAITNIPQAYSPRTGDHVTIPLPPAKIATARSVSSDGVLGGSPMTVTFNASTTFFTVCAGAYPVIFRYRAAGDTNHVTLVSGAYPKDEIVSANSLMQFEKPEGVVSLSLDVLTTQPNISVIEK